MYIKVVSNFYAVCVLENKSNNASLRFYIRNIGGVFSLFLSEKLHRKISMKEYIEGGLSQCVQIETTIETFLTSLQPVCLFSYYV